MAVLSRTVMDTTVTGTSAPRGKTPGTRTSCQSEWILQISTESKYLPGSDTHFCNMDWCLNLCQVHKKIFMNFFISLIHWYFKSIRLYKEKSAASSTPDLPDEIPEVHPEQAVLGSLGAQLPLQVWRPAGPVIRPGSSPGETPPRVPQLQ